MPDDPKKEWDEYVARELAVLMPLLLKLGYSLDTIQPHLSGERYLMQAVTTTSGRKLILLGTRIADDLRVVIKATKDADGMQELTHERVCRNMLKDIGFAYEVFLTPNELLFTFRDGHLISIQEFITQELSFIERALSEQFALALSAFKAQESAHATTYEHVRRVARTFGSMSTNGYLNAFDRFINSIGSTSDLETARALLRERKGTIDQYTGFLTHTDFVPHNFRIVNADIYLLDSSSLRFGNKYEGWARFLNFMTLYNPELEAVLVQYVRDNRTPEESESLKLMRIYRLGEILSYYSGWLENVSGNLLELTQARIAFWSAVLEAQLNDESLDSEMRAAYKDKRNSLRSEDEKLRQKGLH